MEPSKSNVGKETASIGCGFYAAMYPNLHRFLGYIFNQSTISGVKYIGSKKLNPIERIFWMIVTITSVAAGTFLARNVYIKYYASPVIVSFQPEETSISQIPFPAITICNVNLLKTSIITDLYENALEILNEVKEGELELIKDFVEQAAHLDHLSQFCMETPSFRRSLNETLYDANGRMDFMLNLTDALKNFDENATQALQEMAKDSEWQKEEIRIFRNATINCEDMLLKCMWAGDILPCKDIFFKIETPYGHCCVFNMMPQFILQKISLDEGRAKKEIRGIPKTTLLEWEVFAKDDLITKVKDGVDKIKYPKHQQAGGKPYGLTVMANPSLHEYSTCTSNDGWGFRMVAHSPLSYPSIHEYGAALSPNSEVFVDIEPQITVAKEQVLKDIPIDKRGCYLPTDGESQLSFFNCYSMENCYSECVSNHTYQNCSCVHFFMPRNATQKLCGAKQRKCADEVRVNLTTSFGKNSFCGHCYPFCEEIVYKLKMSQFKRRENNAFYSYKNSNHQPENATDYSIIHIFMGIDSFYAKERKKLYDWPDLLASAGGLLSLALGLSILSIIEIGYYFTLRAWFHFHDVFSKQRRG